MDVYHMALAATEKKTKSLVGPVNGSDQFLATIGETSRIRLDVQPCIRPS